LLQKSAGRKRGVLFLITLLQKSSGRRRGVQDIKTKQEGFWEEEGSTGYKDKTSRAVGGRGEHSKLRQNGIYRGRYGAPR
jgi:hypothetical protein